MKRKKYGIFAVTAAAMLLAAWLITSCANPTGASTNAGPRGPRPPEGYGVVRLSTPADMARTIIPDIPAFTSFQVNIRTNPASAEALGTLLHAFTHLDFGITGTTTGQHIYLPAGTYQIEVLAFMDGTPSDSPIPGIPCDPDFSSRPGGTVGGNLVASGRVNDVVVTRGADTSATIYLHAVFTGTGTGTFDWTITMPGGSFIFPDAATMTLTPRGGQILPTPFVVPMDGTDRLTGPGTLNLFTPPNNANMASNVMPVGFYDVVLTFTRYGYQTRVIREVLHISENATSAWPVTVPDLINLVHTVTLVNYSGQVHVGGANDGDPTEMTITIQHGRSLSYHEYFQTGGRFFGTPPYYASGDPNTTLPREWLGWYADPGYTEPWFITPPATELFRYRIITDTRIYGRWQPRSQIGLTVVPVDVSNRMPTITAVTQTQQQIIDRTTALTASDRIIMFELNPPAGTVFIDTSVVWRDEDDNTITRYTDTASGNLTQHIVLDFSDPATFLRYSRVGVHYFSVVAETAAPAPHLPPTPWSGRVRLTINP